MSSAPAPPPGPVEGPEHRACPRCGSPLADGQDWCLNCGAAATTRFAAPPAWRGPLVAMTGVLLVAVAALVLAFFALADDEGSSGPTAGATPTVAATTPAPGASPEPTATPAPTETPSSDGGPGGEPATWPEGRAAWTVVLSSSTSRSAARRRAQRLADDGLTVGVLRSDDFSSLRPGFWVVFSGQYDSSRAAARAQQDLGAAAPASAYVRRITPR